MNRRRRTLQDRALPTELSPHSPSHRTRTCLSAPWEFREAPWLAEKDLVEEAGLEPTWSGRQDLNLRMPFGPAPKAGGQPTCPTSRLKPVAYQASLRPEN